LKGEEHERDYIDSNYIDGFFKKEVEHFNKDIFSLALLCLYKPNKIKFQITSTKQA